jgi:hypothetical protein
MRLVYSDGKWISVELPILDPCWLVSDTWYYARIYAAAVNKGFSEKRSRIIAEAAVNKRIYPEISYDKSIENDLNNLMNVESNNLSEKA